MSRLGKKPIQIPAGVTVNLFNNKVVVKGPKGELSYILRPEVNVVIENNEVVATLKPEFDSSTYFCFWGLTRAYINNMITGVSKGFEKHLELTGVGYRVKQQGKGLNLSLGYSHPVIFEAPADVELTVVDERNIVVKGIDAAVVGQIAANIKRHRVPDAYKAKGIKYKNEVIKTKPGKTGK